MAKNPYPFRSGTLALEDHGYLVASILTQEIALNLCSVFPRKAMHLSTIRTHQP